MAGVRARACVRASASVGMDGSKHYNDAVIHIYLKSYCIILYTVLFRLLLLFMCWHCNFRNGMNKIFCLSIFLLSFFFFFSRCCTMY